MRLESAIRLGATLLTTMLMLNSGGLHAADSAGTAVRPLVHVPFETPAQRDSSKYRLEDASYVASSQGTHALRLDGSLTAPMLRLSSVLSSDAGAISFLFRPDETASTQTSRALLTLTWDGPTRSYLAISQGWWEPAGQDRLYLIVSNESHMHCSTQRRLDAGEWQMVTATWSKGNPGVCRLYVDGVKVAEHLGDYGGGEKASGPIYLGSDLGVSHGRGRRALGLMDDLNIFDRSLTDSEVRRMHDEYAGGRAVAERQRWSWLEAELKSSHDTLAEASKLPQARAIFEPSWTWAGSRADVDSTISRVKAAGFNVLIPCVWHGAGTYFPSARAHSDVRLADHVRSAGFDPLAYLIDRAHAAGIEVHPWFTVVRRDDERRPEFFEEGVPEHAYDIHNASFRNFIVGVILDMVGRYAVDGINLDYVRAMGICQSRSCRADYLRRTGRDLSADVLNAASSRDARAGLQSWQDQAVADVIRRVSAGARSLRPGLIVSIDGNPVPERSRPVEGRDELGWIRSGWVDVVFNMQYSDRLPMELDETVSSMIDPKHHALLVANYDRLDGVAIPRSGQTVADLMRLAAERWPGAPVGVYLLNMLTPEQSTALRDGPFVRSVGTQWPPVTTAPEH